MKQLILTGAVVVAAGLAATAMPRPASDGPSDAPLDAWQQPAIIDATLVGKGSHPRLGIPAFLVPAGDAELTDAAAVVADVLAADLDFEQEFYIIDRAKTASIPNPSDPLALPFQQWSDIGADFVVHAAVLRAGAEFAVELRLVRIRGDERGATRFGRRYGNCTVANPRRCAHYIADDMHKDIRQLDGVAQTQLAFVSDRSGARMTGRPTADAGQAKEIYISDYDGANVRPVTVNRSLVMSPAWAPDGATLAYTLWPPGAAPTVFINTLDGRPVRQIIPPSGDVHNSHPAWSPDGQKIAFVSTKSGNSDIWVINRDGSGQRNLTAGSRAIDNAPTWSPDGTKIAFTSDRSGSNRLYIMNAEDGLGLQVINTGETVDRPTWSAQGVIAYTSGSGWQHSISLYDFNTGVASVLTDQRGDNQSPAFSPTGRHIAFATTRWGREEIAIINRAGQQIRRITNVGNNKGPSWSRARAR